MALIGQIRKRSWILIVFIGIGLGGFIFMDYSSAQNQNGGSAQNVLGVVNGKKVERQNFEKAYSLLYSNSSGDANGQRAYLWNYFLEETIVSEEAEGLGLAVSLAELKDLEFGTNLSPSISQRFRGQNGQVDRAQLNNIKQIIESGTIDDAIANNQLSQQFIPLWQLIEKEVIKNRLQTKIDKLAEKAMYTPSWMTEMGYQEQQHFVDFTYVKVPYDDINPSEISLTAADYDAYVSDNAERFRQKEESRVLNFVTFTVAASASDRDSSKAKIARLIPGFVSAEKDSSYVIRNGGGSMDPTYVKKTAVSTVIADTLFALPVGSVYGPYEESGQYKIVKIQGRQVIPDSVKSRHILRRVQSYAELQQANKTLDSLKTLIETGAFTFDSLAVAFSSDGSASKGGDLGYIGMNGMVKPFNDLIFFEAKKGELNIIQSQFGVHLVEVTGKKFTTNDEGLRLAYITEDIIPSDDTRNEVYEKATAFAGKNTIIADMAKAVEGIADLKVETTPALKANDYAVGTLGSTDDARDMVKWAFKTNTGSVSADVYVFKDPVFAYDNKYVVVGVKAIQKAGIPSAENIKDQIETAVLNSKRAELIKGQITGMDMAAVASKYKVPVDTATRISFSQVFAAGNLGSEPSVIASAFALDQGGTSKAIEGSTGVYIVKMINKPAAPAAPATGLTQVKQTMTANTLRLIFSQPGRASQLLETMVKKAKVTDSRSTFY